MSYIASASCFKLKLSSSSEPDYHGANIVGGCWKAGSFGGGYFRPIYSAVTCAHYGDEAWKELPDDWLEGLDVATQVASPKFVLEHNNVPQNRLPFHSIYSAFQVSVFLRFCDSLSLKCC
jgi:hypothetical protein